MQLPARRPAHRGADVRACERGEPEPRPGTLREAGDEDERRAEQRPWRQPEHGAEQVAVSATCEGIKRYGHRAHDEECGAEQHALVAENVRHDKRRDEHRDQRDEQRATDKALLGSTVFVSAA